LGWFRSLGNEYLNIEFGSLPFVRDLQQVYQLMKNVDKKMAQIVRDNGRGVRRKAVLSDTSTVQLLRAGSVAARFLFVFEQPALGSSFTPSTTTYQEFRTTTEKVWFSAAYRYWIPDVTSWGWNTRARLALFGALPTPELLWEVMPWSWLIDWFSNVGDVVANVSTNAVDNLTFLYSFIMRETKVEHVGISITSIAPKDQVYNILTGDIDHCPGYNHEFRSVEVTHIKRRLGGGNPFGLGVQLPSLSGRQLAILAALGISRGAVL